jgi:hypothetical protein
MPAMPVIPSWTAAALDQALFACAEEPWADQVLLTVLSTLAPMLRARGFTCAEPDEQRLSNQFDQDHVSTHVMRRLGVVDPLGVSDGQRLQANVGIGVMGRLGLAGTRAPDGVWTRSVRLVASVSLAIGYVGTSGERLAGGAPMLVNLSLVSTGCDLFVADTAQVAEWWRTTCGPDVLQSLRGHPPQLLPSLLPGLVGKPEEPQSLAQLLEDLVERCVAEMAP